MSSFDPRIDQYIAQSAEFAQPILLHLRELVHQACPGVNENIKWGFPHFEYGKSILCSMASFKQHCAFSFWLGKFMTDSQNILEKRGETAMGHLGRLTELKDLPKDTLLISYIHEAMQLIDKGITLKSAPKTKKQPAELIVPDYILEALQTNEKAQQTFEQFSYSHRKEYVEWISEAKTEATRNKRINTMLEWLENGKGRNWKYER